MNRPGLAIFLGLAACYNPSTVTLLCPSGQTDCPVDQRCVDGLCKPVVDGSDDMTMPDLAATDAGGPADLARPGGCKAGNAIVVGAKVRACQGTFAAGGGSALCGTGYSVCTTLAAGDIAACRNLSAFFVADQPAYFVGSPSNETCGTSLANQVIYGCGQAGSSGARQCGGFPVELALGASLMSPNGSFASLANNDPNQGVLCCLP